MTYFIHNLSSRHKFLSITDKTATNFRRWLSLVERLMQFKSISLLWIFVRKLWSWWCFFDKKIQEDIIPHYLKKITFDSQRCILRKKILNIWLEINHRKSIIKIIIKELLFQTKFVFITIRQYDFTDATCILWRILYKI